MKPKPKFRLLAREFTSDEFFPETGRPTKRRRNLEPNSHRKQNIITGCLSLLTTSAALFCAAVIPTPEAVAQTVAPPHTVAPSATVAEADQSADLAKKLNNPISSLISVPFQSNWDFNIGQADGTRYTLNIQPVIPLSISKDWNLIIRTILPVISQTDVFGNSGTQSGLGNTTQSFFLSPKASWNGVTWGLGPVGYYPTNTDSLLGPDKWGLGPTFVALVQPGQWTIGALANQIWSVGGSHNDQNISSTFLQPFIVYTTKSHTSFALNTESTYDWETSQWTVPINLTIQQVFKIGKQPMALQIGGRYYAAAPSGGADWGLRANFTLLFPTAKPKPEPGHVSGTTK